MQVLSAVTLTWQTSFFFSQCPGKVSGLLDPQAQPGAAAELFLNPSLLLEGHSRTTTMLNVFKKCGCSSCSRGAHCTHGCSNRGKPQEWWQQKVTSWYLVPGVCLSPGSLTVVIILALGTRECAPLGAFPNTNNWLFSQRHCCIDWNGEKFQVPRQE